MTDYERLYALIEKASAVIDEAMQLLSTCKGVTQPTDELLKRLEDFGRASAYEHELLTRNSAELN